MKYCKKCGAQLEEGQTCNCTVSSTMPTSARATPPSPVRATPPSAATRQTPPTQTPQKWSPQTTPQSPPRRTPPAQPPTIPTSTGISAFKRFIKTVMNKLGIDDLHRKLTAYYERGKLIVPECIVPNEGEMPVKQYNVAVLRNLFRFERAEGRMLVTNKRLLFRATGRSVGGSTSFQQEFAIDELAGVEAHCNYRFHLFLFLVDLFKLMIMLLVISAVCFVIFGIIRLPGAIPNSVINNIHNGAVQNAQIKYEAAVQDYYELSRKTSDQSDPPDRSSFMPNESVYSTLRIFFSIAGYVISIAILVFLIRLRKRILLMLAIRFLKRFLLTLIRIGLRPNLVLLIKTKGGMDGAAPIKIQRERSFLFRRQGTENGFSEVMPTVDTKAAIKELGAIINDIQKLGDHGVNKWMI